MDEILERNTFGYSHDACFRKTKTWRERENVRGKESYNQILILNRWLTSQRKKYKIGTETGRSKDRKRLNRDWHLASTPAIVIWTEICGLRRTF